MFVFRSLSRKKDISTLNPVRLVNKRLYNTFSHSVNEAWILRAESLKGYYFEFVFFFLILIDSPTCYHCVALLLNLIVPSLLKYLMQSSRSLNTSQSAATMFFPLKVIYSSSFYSVPVTNRSLNFLVHLFFSHLISVILRLPLFY